MNKQDILAQDQTQAEGSRTTAEAQVQEKDNKATPPTTARTSSRGKPKRRKNKVEPLTQAMLEAIEILPQMASAKFIEMVTEKELSNEEIVDIFFPYVFNTHEVSKIKASVKFSKGKGEKRADMRNIKPEAMVAMRLLWGVDLNALVDDCYDPPVS